MVKIRRKCVYVSQFFCSKTASCFKEIRGLRNFLANNRVLRPVITEQISGISDSNNFCTDVKSQRFSKISSWGVAEWLRNFGSRFIFILIFRNEK